MLVSNGYEELTNLCSIWDVTRGKTSKIIDALSERFVTENESDLSANKEQGCDSASSSPVHQKQDSSASSSPRSASGFYSSKDWSACITLD